jgi:hypothetical protein
VSIAFCEHGQDRRTCLKCAESNSNVISIPEHFKKAADDTSKALMSARDSGKENSVVFSRDGIIYLSHQNMLMAFTPEEAIILSEAVMTAGWELKTETENEDDTETREEPGEPAESDSGKG